MSCLASVFASPPREKKKAKSTVKSHFGGEVTQGYHLLLWKRFKRALRPGLTQPDLKPRVTSAPTHYDLCVHFQYPGPLQGEPYKTQALLCVPVIPQQRYTATRQPTHKRGEPSLTRQSPNISRCYPNPTYTPKSSKPFPNSL